MTRILFILTALMPILAGCANLGPRNTIQTQNALRVDFVDLQRSPEAYRGKQIILGGVIVKTTNKKEGTLIEIYQTRLDDSNRPVDIDISQGRFLALYERFLDNKIYQPGRKITVIGLAQGERVLQLDEISYHYPLVKVIELNLFQEESPPPYPPYYPYYDYPWPPWDPWYPWGPGYPWDRRRLYWR
jgi:outer membrane lipoprotein